MSADIPDILLERYRLKELPPDAAAQLEDRIRRDERLRRRLDALDRSDEEIHRSGVLERLADRLPRSRPAPRRFVAYVAVPVAVAALAMMALIVAPRTQMPANGDRIKGLTPALAVYRRTAHGSETLADGAVARPGDLLRVGYRAAGKPEGVILSIDGRG